MGVGVFTDEAAPAVGVLVGRVPAEERLERVQRGQYEPPTRAQDPSELGDGSFEVRNVGDREAAHDEVGRRVAGGKGEEVAQGEGRAE